MKRPHRYYGPKHIFDYTVLAKGLMPFRTDSIEEAIRTAKKRNAISSHVSVIDLEDQIIHEWRSGRKIPCDKLYRLLKPRQAFFL